MAEVGVQLSGRESRRVLQAAIPSLWGMLVYRPVTSAVHMKLSGGRDPTVRIFLRKCVVSYIYEETPVARGLRW